ncbi:MAG: trypsin-like serine protease [Alphaproteobacteria bacterium]|nr:trypsin-like serine protease [Alphaproteobacteria bacterium]
MTSLLPSLVLTLIAALAEEGAAIAPPLLAEPPSAVGVLINAADENCTGTLIADDVVLTAAHCLMEGKTDHLAFPKTFRVYDREAGETLSSAARSIVLPRGYDYLHWQDSEEINHLDWALVVLREPLGNRVGTLPVVGLSHSAAMRTLAAGYGYVGYGANKGKSATIYRDCKVINWSLDGTFTDDCGTVEGDSGGPAIALRNGRPIIVGVVSAELDGGDDLTVSSVAFADDVLAFLENPGDPGGRSTIAPRPWPEADGTKAPRTLASVFWNGRETAPWPSLSFACRDGNVALAFRPGIVPAIADLWHAPHVAVEVTAGERPTTSLNGSFFDDGILLQDKNLVPRLIAAAQISAPGTRRGASVRLASAAGITTSVWFSLDGFREAEASFASQCAASRPAR